MLQAVNNLGADSQFDLYIYALGISGLIMLFMGIAGFGATGGARLVSVLVGLAFLGYGGYLAFVFDGTSYTIFVYVFIAPILVIVNAVRSAKARKEAAKVHQQQG
jgi:hypothetical protein